MLPRQQLIIIKVELVLIIFYNKHENSSNCKHFIAYDLECWNGTDRNHFDVRVYDQDLVEKYLHPFETRIRDAQVASIMCSFNTIDGIPACVNQFILDNIAR